MTNNIICIAGMHRSGSSLTASWLEKCGLNLHNKIGPSTGNEKGHFEDKDLVDFHADIIKRENKHSKGWIIKGNGNLKFNTNDLEKAHNIIIKKNEITETWGWKDPRTALFLSDWKKIIPNLKVIIIWRNCYSSVDSLIRRSNKATTPLVKISFKQSVINWKLYNRKLLDYYLDNKKDTILLPITSILGSDSEVIKLINSKFNFKLDYFAIDKLFDKEVFMVSDDLKIKHKVFCALNNTNLLERKLKNNSTVI